MARKNPVAIKGSVKTVPKGARKGQIITRGGQRFRVVSFVNSNGTRVRYLQKITKCSPAARKPACKKRRIARKRKSNPFLGQPYSTCNLPGDKDKWKRGHRYLDGRGVLCVVQKTKGGKSWVAMAHDKAKPSVTGRKVGARFQFNRERYVVARRRTRTGGYKKYAKKVS